MIKIIQDLKDKFRELYLKSSAMREIILKDLKKENENKN